MGSPKQQNRPLAGSSCIKTSGIKTPGVILVAGASSGMGKACADLFVQGNPRVYAASRNMARASGRFIGLNMDVRSSAAVAKGVERIVSEQGRLALGLISRYYRIR